VVSACSCHERSVNGPNLTPIHNEPFGCALKGFDIEVAAGQ
jgi:hypothetical protein